MKIENRLLCETEKNSIGRDMPSNFSLVVSSRFGVLYQIYSDELEQWDNCSMNQTHIVCTEKGSLQSLTINRTTGEFSLFGYNKMPRIAVSGRGICKAVTGI